MRVKLSLSQRLLPIIYYLHSIAKTKPNICLKRYFDVNAYTLLCYYLFTVYYEKHNLLNDLPRLICLYNICHSTYLSVYFRKFSFFKLYLYMYLLQHSNIAKIILSINLPRSKKICYFYAVLNKIVRLHTYIIIYIHRTRVNYFLWGVEFFFFYIYYCNKSIHT